MDVLRIVALYKGGIKTDIDTLDRSLLKRKDVGSIDIVTIDDEAKDISIDELGRKIHSIQLSQCKDVKRRTLSPGCLFNFYSKLNSITAINDYDVMHIHSPHLPIANIASVVAVRRQIPTVVTYHGSKRKSTVHNLGMRACAALPIGLASENFSISQAARYLQGEGSTIIGVPIDRNQFFYTRNKDYLPRNDKDSTMIFYGSRIVKNKGQLDLVDATNLLADQGKRNFEVVIAGDIEDKEYYQEMISRIGRYKLKNVHLMDEIPFERMNDAFNSADIQVFPTYEEGLGKIIAEAGLCRVPTVAYNTGGVPELIRDSHNGFLVERGDISGLSEKVAQLMDDPDKRERFGGACYQEFSERFCPQRMANQHMEVYSKAKIRSDSNWLRSSLTFTYKVYKSISMYC